MEKIRKVIIPAAGRGTRLYPITRAQPKEMLPILDKPVIHYVVEEAIKSGIEDILMVVGKGKESLINYFDGLEGMPEIFYVRQKEPLGLGDAIRYGESFVDGEPFAVLLGDTIYESNSKETPTSQMIAAFNKLSAPVIGIEKVEKELVKQYGIIEGIKVGDRLFEVKSLVEKPEPSEAPSNLAIIGNYILQPDIFDYLKMIKPRKNNEYQLTDALDLLSKEKKLYALELEGIRYDIGNIESWVRTFVEFAKKRYPMYV